MGFAIVTVIVTVTKFVFSVNEIQNKRIFLHPLSADDFECVFLADEGLCRINTPSLKKKFRIFDYSLKFLTTSYIILDT